MVLVNTVSDILVTDVRAALRRRVADVGGTELGRAFAAWLLGDSGKDGGLASPVNDAATREGAMQDFPTVAILGFGAHAGILGADQIEALKKGLRRQAGREVVIDGLPVAFCSDAVGILGIALGTKTVADTELTDLVLKWFSKFLKNSYDAERTDDWQRCLFAAGDRQLGSTLRLSVPNSAASADVRVALLARNVIEAGEDGAVERDRHQTLTLTIRELPNDLSYERAALRLAAIESVVQATMPVVGANAARSTKRGHSLSDRDQRLHEAIGKENFCTLTNAEIMRDAKVKKLLRAEKLEPSSDAAKSCLNRIREANAYPMSREVSQKRLSRN